MSVLRLFISALRTHAVLVQLNAAQRAAILALLGLIRLRRPVDAGFNRILHLNGQNAGVPMQVLRLTLEAVKAGAY